MKVIKIDINLIKCRNFDLESSLKLGIGHGEIVCCIQSTALATKKPAQSCNEMFSSPVSFKSRIKALRRIFKYHHFPAIEYQYAENGSLSPTFRWIGDIVLQIVTTLSSAYTVFNAIISRLIINKIKVLFLI